MPGVLIAHQWMGLGQGEMYRAEEMASHGYTAFALDVYGQGVRPTNEEEAGGNMTVCVCVCLCVCVHDDETDDETERKHTPPKPPTPPTLHRP